MVHRDGSRSEGNGSYICKQFVIDLLGILAHSSYVAIGNAVIRREDCGIDGIVVGVSDSDVRLILSISV